MKNTNKKELWLLGILSFLLFQAPVSANTTEDDKTLSPYFKVSGKNNMGDESLPLLETSAKVDIVGVIADVKVRQVYQNRSESPIDAIYVFPGSTKAAVYGMRMTIDERVVVAKIRNEKLQRLLILRPKNKGNEPHYWNSNGLMFSK